MKAWENLQRQIVACDRCPRLREYCQQIGREKRRAFADWEYWAQPVPNFGQAPAPLLIVGLAPAAHGANRTGRMFTGDKSGEWLYRALHKAGFANQPSSTNRNDGLKLHACVITAVCHCAPPDNKPAPDEIAWKAVVSEVRRRDWHSGRVPVFGHGAKQSLLGGRWLLGSYHPSQQNTFTGKLTEPMFDKIFAQARQLIDRNS